MVAGVVDGTVFEWIARMASAVALWATVRAHRVQLGHDPIKEAQDLTERLQHPVRWTVKHPIQAVERFFR